MSTDFLLSFRRRPGADFLSFSSSSSRSDIRPKLNAGEVQQVSALLSSIPLPKKKEKKKNPIIVTAEERRRSNAQVLDSSWGEKSFAVREEMRVSVELSFFQHLKVYHLPQNQP